MDWHNILHVGFSIWEEEKCTNSKLLLLHLLLTIEELIFQHNYSAQAVLQMWILVSLKSEDSTTHFCLKWHFLYFVKLHLRLWKHC